MKMMKSLSRVISLQLFLIILQLSVFAAQQHEVYIVQIEDRSLKRNLMEIENNHFSYLSSVKKTEVEAKASFLYSYKNIINGFSALLAPDEAQKLSEMDRVVSVVKSGQLSYRLQTTRSWEFTDSLAGENFRFINGDQRPLNNANYGKDVIVGVIDSGVWPESESFNDEGLGPVPQSWKGTCQTGANFNSSHCNRKLIGARYYLKGYEARYGRLNDSIDIRSARDRDGHGTHTASTVAGRQVSGAALLGGFANGTAAGGAPLARLAVYKVCWAIPGQSTMFDSTCAGEDMIAAFDDAVADGVDIISISIVPYELSSYGEDGIAFGAFHAAKRDILVVASGGNAGPAPASVRNVAPWIVSVGASSIDRVFSSPVFLGNGLIIEGESVSPHSLSHMLPLVYAGDVETAGTTDNKTSGLCISGSLSPELVQGKIVLCLKGSSSTVEKGLEVKRAGGAGLIVENPVDGISIAVTAHVLPGTAIFSKDSARVLNYIKTSSNPTARIVPVKTVLGAKPSPFMAGFSSTGPNLLDPSILKPDITAPGLNILAAWSEATSPTKLFDDGRIVKYNVLSGTSMSCPHVAAAAAIVKSAHPNWSSAAVRSALMTTATQTNNLGLPITDGGGTSAATPFNYGSGHFRPLIALDPGLVYDANYTDYLLYLCNYKSSLEILEPSFTCPDLVPSPSDLNYPSVSVAAVNSSGVVVTRTVTNVGEGGGVYRVSVEAPAGYAVAVSPESLRFSNVGERKKFSILIRPNGNMQNDHEFGWYSWSDGNHSVRSPIVVSR